jgi:MerR family transcriptional regulator/heat shock protein HspR
MDALENNDDPLFPISVAAKLLKISVHTLRMYEREGLIIPFKKETNHRLYSRSDIERLSCIRRAINEHKISIAGIKTIYALIPCWKINNCSEEKRKDCRGFNSYFEPCWSFNHNGTNCIKPDCRECEVYKNYSECNSIKELIISMLNKN